MIENMALGDIKMRHLSLLLIVLFLISCKYKEIKSYKHFRIAGKTQGTVYHVTYRVYDSVNLQPAIDSILHEFDLSLSTYDSNSIISAINRNDEDVQVDEKFLHVFNKAKIIHEKSGGVFDITVAPLVDAWGFGKTKNKTGKPSKRELDSLLKYVGMDKIWTEGKKVRKSDPRVQLDVNAIAQGYAVDIVSRYLDDIGIGNYLVEIGGEIRAKGVNPKNMIWRVGVDKPTDDYHLPGQEMKAIVQLPNMSLATSGNYRKFFVEDGVKYAHSIDPETGLPVKHQLLSASVFSKECIVADAYATACMVMGLERSKEMIQNERGLEGYFIYSDKHGLLHTFYTKGVEKLLTEEY